MCRPNFFDVRYDINPWMKNQIGKVDNNKAIDQWNRLLYAISKHSIVYLLDGDPQVPDLVFTANAGIIFKNIAIISKFKYPQRRSEEPIWRKWFESKGYAVVQPQHFFEGAGDLLKDSVNRYWLGTGFRTDPAVAVELKKILNNEVIVLELSNPYWYHLDTCFCPLSNGELLWYPDAFTIASQQLIKSNFKTTVEVSDHDAAGFACNAVCIENQIFMPAATSVQNELNTLGYQIIDFDLSEFQKSGGSAKCLTLEIE